MPRDESGKRKTKSTKAKRNHDLNGKYSSKAVRKYEQQIANAAPVEPKTKLKKK
jgi:hypothetical protein